MCVCELNKHLLLFWDTANVKGLKCVLPLMKRYFIYKEQVWTDHGSITPSANVLHKGDSEGVKSLLFYFMLALFI